MLPSNTTSPSSGRVLPVMTSIIVVLPAPFGPMIARISPGSTASDNPFKRAEAVERNADVVEIKLRGCGADVHSRHSAGRAAASADTRLRLCARRSARQ